MKRTHFLSAARCGALLALSLAGGAAMGADWPSWRGPSQNGVSLETNLPSSCKEVLWRAPYGGRSTPAIFDGRVYAINLTGQGVMAQEQVFALDLKTGKLLWSHPFNVFHTDVPDTRVGWANVTVDPQTGYVYAHGVQGMFFCFDRDGKVIWSKSLTELYGRISGYGGRTHTPVIDEDRVVINFNSSSFGAHAVGAHRYLAMDKRTGEVLWWGAPGGRPEDTTYSCPVVAVVDGQRLLVAGNADGGIYAMEARTGEKVWGFDFSQRGMNTSVVAEGRRVYATHSEENHDSTAMGRVVCIDARGKGDVTKTHELWRADGIDAGYASPLLHGGRLYVMSNSGVLYCFDAEKGRKIWEITVGRIGKGSPVWGDGKIYLTTGNGDFAIVEDAGDRARLLDKTSFETKGEGNVELFGSPAVSDGRVVFFTTTEMICLGRKNAARQDVAIPPLPAEAPADPAAAPAALLVRPAEVLVRPGERVQFEALACDKLGRSLRKVEAQWSWTAKSGSIGGDGRLETAAGTSGGTGVVSARLGELSGAARVRIVPDLPIREDFESHKDGDAVDWWIGCSKGRYEIETLDGSKVLKKLADGRGPIFNRSHVFITPPIAPGYTVEADVMGVKEGRTRGDVGLINDRYVLELIGATQRLRVMSWVPGPRFEKRIDFPWEPGRWLRAKLRVDVQGSEARLYAKVWPRDQAEPASWTLEATDPQPNLEGSAGIYANSSAPLCFDNVHVYR